MRRRIRVEIYADVLNAVHQTRKSNEPLTMYRIERMTGLSHMRLKERLSELIKMGLADDRLVVTDRGYRFLQEFSSSLRPLMVRYEFVNEEVKS